MSQPLVTKKESEKRTKKRPRRHILFILRADLWRGYVIIMETGTVKLRKPLPNMSRQVMPRFVVVPKLSQGGKDLGNPPQMILRTTQAVPLWQYYLKLSMRTTITVTTSTSTTSTTSPPLHQHGDPSWRTQTSFEPYSFFPLIASATLLHSAHPWVKILAGPSQRIVHGPSYCLVPSYPVVRVSTTSFQFYSTHDLKIFYSY
jgi:hypothetical protein